MIFEFRTTDHPEANGRKPVHDEVAWRVNCEVEQGTLYVNFGQKGRDALLTMLLEDTMIDCNDQLPKQGERVMLFDRQLKKWVFATFTMRENNELWEIDPKIFYPVNHFRFSHWMSSPEQPGATNVNSNRPEGN